MKARKKTIFKWIPSIIVGIMITGSAIFKLASAPPVVELFSRIGLGEFVAVFGAIELLFIFLFLHPAFSRLGMMLLTGYFGGAMAIEMASAGNMFIPAVILSLVWIAGIIRNPTFFKTQVGQSNHFSSPQKSLI